MNQLSEGQNGLEKGIEKYKVLQKLMEKNVNYRCLDASNLALSEADCWVALGKIQRQFAQGDESESDFKHHIDTALDKLSSADTIYHDEKNAKVYPDRCMKGRAEVLKEKGHIQVLLENPKEAMAEWKEAINCYNKAGDKNGATDTTGLLNKLSFNLDKNAFIHAQRKDTENQEREAVLKAFQKFDADHSGEMDASEFAELAIELGTDPPLSSEELEEAMSQLDSSSDGKISFEEFWSWWITDEIQAMLNKRQD